MLDGSHGIHKYFLVEPRKTLPNEVGVGGGGGCYYVGAIIRDNMVCIRVKWLL